MIFKSTLLAAGLVISMITPAQANDPAKLTDLQIAHVAYIADNIDIRYAHLALAISTNPAIRTFAETMIRDHTAVNDQALALLSKLNAKPEDNFLSQSLLEGADKLINEMSQLRGAAFDKRYAENELAYHKAVNDLVGNIFIPNIENAEVRALFEAGHEIFLAHQHHAEKTVAEIN